MDRLLYKHEITLIENNQIIKINYIDFYVYLPMQPEAEALWPATPSYLSQKRHTQQLIHTRITVYVLN